jgi:hypothetical protein
MRATNYGHNIVVPFSSGNACYVIATTEGKLHILSCTYHFYVDYRYCNLEELQYLHNTSDVHVTVKSWMEVGVISRTPVGRLFVTFFFSTKFL